MNPHFAGGPVPGSGPRQRFFNLRFAARHVGGDRDTDFLHPMFGTQDAGNVPNADTTEGNNQVRAGDLLRSLGRDPNGQIIVHRMRVTQTVAQAVNRDLNVNLRRQTEGGAAGSVGTAVVLSGGVAGETDETQGQGGVLFERNQMMAVNYTTSGADAANFAASNVVAELDIEVA